MPKIEVQIGSNESTNENQGGGSQGLQFENTLFERQIGRIRKLENQCAKAASDGIIPIKYKESFPSTRRNGATPNSFSISGPFSNFEPFSSEPLIGSWQFRAI